MNTTFVRKSALWLATLCMALMLALPVTSSTATGTRNPGGITVMDPGGGHNGG